MTQTIAGTYDLAFMVLARMGVGMPGVGMRGLGMHGVACMWLLQTCRGLACMRLDGWGWA